jgi:hypothetical protein
MPLKPEQRAAVVWARADRRHQGTGDPTPEEIAAAEQTFTAEQEEAIARNLAQAPMPTPEVIATLRRLVRWHEAG